MRRRTASSLRASTARSCDEDDEGEKVKKEEEGKEGKEEEASHKTGGQ